MMMMMLMRIVETERHCRTWGIDLAKREKLYALFVSP